MNNKTITLKEFYRHYHKKFWCFKKCYKSYKFLDDVFTISGICLVTIGTITGGITLNPVILGVINGAGVIVAGIGKNKNYKKKIELSKIAYTTYEKTLVELRSALRGDEFDKDDFIDRMKLIISLPSIANISMTNNKRNSISKMGGSESRICRRDLWGTEKIIIFRQPLKTKDKKLNRE